MKTFEIAMTVGVGAIVLMSVIDWVVLWRLGRRIEKLEDQRS